MERDPRTDPRPGDVIRKGRQERVVERLVYDVVYWRRLAGLGVGDGRMLLSGWRRWARDAVVVEVTP